MADLSSNLLYPLLSEVAEPLRTLVDGYFADTLDADQIKALEGLLLSDSDARRFFARYSELDRDLKREAHAHIQTGTALARLGMTQTATMNLNRRMQIRPWRWAATAAALVVAIGAGWWAESHFAAPPPRVVERSTPQPDIAAIINAQNCKWKDEVTPADMLPGRLVEIERGLVELRFRSGTEIVLEGPAKLELLSPNSARLHHGRLTGKAGVIKGFEVFSPRGRVVDLGTEFGVHVADSGDTDVYVFNGKVQAFGRNDRRLDLVGLQSARLDDAGATLRPSIDPGLFIREIVAPPIIEPRTLRVNFGKGYDSTLSDSQGVGTGLNYRLPGTGVALEVNDPNLLVDAESGQLELTTTRSDINGQSGMPTGEYLGARLADLGFTGTEDFAVEVFLPNIPALQNVGQFGLYAGSKSDKVIRGGLISRGKEGPYTLFMTNNDGGRDRDSHFLGLFSMGDDLRIRLKRTNGKYDLTVENVTTGSESTLAIRHPAFLDAENDLYVGLFGANTGSDVSRKLLVRELAVTVWTKAGNKHDAVVSAR